MALGVPILKHFRVQRTEHIKINLLTVLACMNITFVELFYLINTENPTYQINLSNIYNFYSTSNS